eukprot:2920849-Rhodomonas_salina.3
MPDGTKKAGADVAYGGTASTAKSTESSVLYGGRAGGDVGAGGRDRRLDHENGDGYSQQRPGRRVHLPAPSPQYQVRSAPAMAYALAMPCL